MKKHLLTALLGLAVSASVWAAPAGLTAPQPAVNDDGQTVILPVKPQKSVLRDSMVITEGDFSYELFYDMTARLTRYNGNDTKVSVPESVSYQGITFKVTEIGDKAFSDCSRLTSITLPNAITSIGNSAFSGCSGLTSITLPNSITKIGDWAFLLCSGITSITLPNSITSIGDNAFYGCSGLTSIILPNSITQIGNSAFSGCSGLTSITLSNSITKIENSAFSDCSGLTSITLPNSITEIGNKAFYRCTGLTSITLPNSITTIGGGAFESCKGLTSITLPNSITSIGNRAFLSCSGLTSITLPNSITQIGNSAFSGCSGLTSITLPNSITSIGSSAFSGCSGLTGITLPNSITEIGDDAFIWCSGLKSITLPNSITSIGDGALEGCSGLTSITLPNSVTSIGDYAFADCSGLKSVFFESKEPSGMSLGANIFYDTNSDLTLYVPVLAMGDYRQLFPGQAVAADPNITVTITDAKYATYYSEKTYTMPTGLTGAIVTDANAEGTLSLSWKYKAGDAVPAGTALLLKGDEGLYDMSDFTTTSSAVPANNLLRGSVALSVTKAADDAQDALFYKLSYNNEGTEVGFYWGNAEGAAFINPAHRCYLALPKAQYAHVKGFRLEGDDTVTAITDVNADGSAKAQKIYTLDGRRVNASSTQGLPAGLYIVEGVKTIVK